MAKSDGRGAPGGTGMLLLALLERRDMYGYEMVEALRAQSREIFHLKAGTLYPLLHTMVSQGHLTCRVLDCSGKIRKYYRNTKEGRRVLRQKTEEWNEYAGAVARVLSFGGNAYGTV